MRHFVIKVVLISAIATALWWATGDWTRPVTIAAAKTLHAVVGYPAPHLLADLDHYHWFAPLFPPLVGLVLASHWITWSRRLVGLVMGLAAFTYLVALQIAVVYSPYLTLSGTRAYLMTAQVTLNSVAVPVVLWLIVAGPPPTGREAEHGRIGRLAVVALWMLLFCAVLTLPIPLAAAETTPSLSAARRAAGAAIAHHQPGIALKHTRDMLDIQQTNAALSYLRMHLFREIGDESAALASESRALTTTARKAAFREIWQ